MVSFNNFSFRYGGSQGVEDWALRDINLTFGAGEIVLILGRSGCGKSTLGLAVTGIVPHLREGTVEGGVTVGGSSVLETSLFEMAKRVGIVFQDPEVQLFALTVEDELAMSLESFGVDRVEMKARVEWALSVCALTGLELHAPARLSGGQKQRVAIAAVLARDPEVLVFDEPTGNLDPTGTRTIYEVIRRICIERGRTVVLIEHDLAPVINMVDRVHVLEEGKVEFQGLPREALSQLELMRHIGVKIPVATDLALRLSKRGMISYRQTPLATEEAADGIQLALSKNLQSLANAAFAIKSHGERPISPRSDPPIVSFNSVTHLYPTGHRAIENINFRVYPGDFLGLLGMNGAGKTTLALHVMGILTPTQGDVFVDGFNTREASVAELARSVGLVFQNPNHQLFKPSVEEELRFGPENLKWEEGRIREAMRRVLELTSLEGLEKSDPESLSTGEKKRVAIASILIMDPKILLVDEPTTGQDQRALAPILELLSRLNREGMTVLMITHDMEVAMKFSSRIVVLASGHIIGDGSPRQIFLQDDILEQAGLVRPELLQMTAALTNNKPFWVESLTELEAAVVAAFDQS